MKIKVKTDYDGCSYIKAGKVYDAEVLENREYGNTAAGYLFSFTDEDGDKCISCEYHCVHIDGHNFDVVNE